MNLESLEGKIRDGIFFCVNKSDNFSVRVFSPSDTWKKLSQPLLLHFPFGMDTYVHHTKY
jgi:hypothetical protein